MTTASAAYAEPATDTVPGVPIRVSPAHCGRPGSANGGWVAGLAAGLLTGPHTPAGTPIEVTPRAVLPLDVTVTGHRDGERAFLVGAGAAVFAEAAVVTGLSPAPACVPLAVAERACRSGSQVESPFPGCYVCGFERDGGLRIALGRAGADGFAGVWTPAVSGELPARYVWAALHCPAGLVYLEGGGRVLLERVTLARHRAPVPGEPHVVVAAPGGGEGRTRFSVAALYTSAGDLVAHSATAWTV
jgi:hypothetical protein